jgi:hypothetical protein
LKIKSIIPNINSNHFEESMKKVIVLASVVAIVFLTWYSTAYSQGTYSGSLTLSSQADVNSFNYSEVTGNLTIQGAGITDLSPMNVLNSVGANLWIYQTGITTIEGFENLTSVGTNLIIDENQYLSSFSAFNSLTDVNGIQVYQNPSLTNFSGFNLVTSTSDYVDIIDNASLESFSGFDAWQTCSLSIGIGENPSLKQIPAFGSLKTVRFNIDIFDNVSLESITSFKNVESVGWINIWNNTMLNNYCGFYNFLSANSSYSRFRTNGNLLNPTVQDVINGGQCIPTPDELISKLYSKVSESNLPKGLKRSLLASLENAMKSLEKGNTGAAINQLQAFVNKVEAQRGKEIAETAANEWIACAQAAIDAIEASLAKKGNGEQITFGEVTPTTYSLKQNFPNPFNPSTVISYAIPAASNVRIEVFNVTGEKVATLVDGFKSEGYYEVSFNASGLPSGLYLYRISAGSFVTTKKMVLMK